MKEVLAQITAPHFSAGLVLVNARVTETAPIIKYMRGWSATRCAAYCAGKGWHIARVTTIGGKEWGNISDKLGATVGLMEALAADADEGGLALWPDEDEGTGA